MMQQRLVEIAGGRGARNASRYLRVEIHLPDSIMPLDFVSSGRTTGHDICSG
jgi:hypothetical protein